ncbi:MAG TPA: ABC transporter substrate-binding protein [Methylomirabilota bacterium]|nr:ABC transporter substrate-binding protein [Methylomirabilota bacterium]
MERRTFIGVIAGGLVAAPLAAEAQRAGKVPRIGYLHVVPRPSPFFQMLGQGLRDLGYVEDQDFTFEYRSADGKVERLPTLAADLVHLNVDLIVASTAPAARAAKEATTTIPILMVGVNYDPLALGYVASLARPGGNITGLFFLHLDLLAKRLGVFKEMLPSVGRVAVLSDPLSADQLKQVEVVNRSLGFKLHPVELRVPQLDVESAFRAAVRSRAEGLFVLETVNIFRERSQIAQLALEARLPTSFAFREYVDAGGLASYGVNFTDMARRAAIYVEKILKGANPADMPVEQATTFELVINLKTAKALGLTIPPSLLQRADQVIE